MSSNDSENFQQLMEAIKGVGEKLEYRLESHNNDLEKKINRLNIKFDSHSNYIGQKIKKIEYQYRGYYKNIDEITEQLKSQNDTIKKLEENFFKKINEQNKNIEKLEKTIEEINTEEISKAFEKLKRTEEFLIARNNDRDRSFNYFIDSKYPAIQKETSSLKENGTAFNASPEDFDPEHPFSK